MKPYWSDESIELYHGGGGRIMTHECPFSAEPADHLFAEGC